MKILYIVIKMMRYCKKILNGNIFSIKLNTSYNNSYDEAMNKSSIYEYKFNKMNKYYEE